MWNRALENMKAWLQSPEAKLVNKLEAQLSEKHPMSMARWLLLLPAAVPKYQKWGLGLVLLYRVMPDAYAWGIEEGEFSWVLESNKLSRGTLERGGAKLQKTYRMYDLKFD